jgi:hypothetical protein
MTKKKYHSILKIFIQISIFYLIVEGLVHLSGIRTISLDKIIQKEIVIYIEMVTRMWGGAALFLAWIMWLILNNIEKYQKILIGSGVMAIIAGISLVPVILATFESTLPLASMYLWMPFYSKVNFLKVIYVFSYAGFIFYGQHKKYLSFEEN